MLRAIYVHDITEKEAPVFVYNEKEGAFDYGEMNYDFYIVMNDPEWLVFVTNGESSYPIENKNRASEEEISSLLGLSD